MWKDWFTDQSTPPHCIDLITFFLFFPSLPPPPPPPPSLIFVLLSNRISLHWKISCHKKKTQFRFIFPFLTSNLNFRITRVTTFKSNQRPIHSQSSLILVKDVIIFFLDLLKYWKLTCRPSNFIATVSIWLEVIASRAGFPFGLTA